MPVLRQLVAEAQAAQGRVGVVNPRLPGLHNDLIQLVKKLMRRMLSWYTRPLLDYHAATTQFLAEAAQMLERQQTQLRGLEEVLATLTADLAELRKQLQSRLNGIERAREISQRQG
jgi:ABC-type transporter Mla subunit MlaD